MKNQRNIKFLKIYRINFMLQQWKIVNIFLMSINIFHLCVWNLWDSWTKSQMHKSFDRELSVANQKSPCRRRLWILQSKYFAFSKPRHDFQTHILYRILLCTLIRCETFVTPIKRDRMSSYPSNQLFITFFLLLSWWLVLTVFFMVYSEVMLLISSMV